MKHTGWGRRGDTGQPPPPSGSPERHRDPTGQRGAARGPQPPSARPPPRCPPRTPTRRSRGGARSPALPRTTSARPPPARVAGLMTSLGGDAAGAAAAERRRRAEAPSLRRRRGACAVAAGPASRAAMREGAPSPRQRGLHARPEAGVGLEGRRGPKMSGGERRALRDLLRSWGRGRGRAEVRGWRPGGSGAVGWEIRRETQWNAGIRAERGDMGKGAPGSGQHGES